MRSCALKSLKAHGSVSPLVFLWARSPNKCQDWKRKSLITVHPHFDPCQPFSRFAGRRSWRNEELSGAASQSALHLPAAFVHPHAAHNRVNHLTTCMCMCITAEHVPSVLADCEGQP